MSATQGVEVAGKRGCSFRAESVPPGTNRYSAETAASFTSLRLSRLGGESALAQRLGYFADLHGVDLQPGLRAALERLLRPGSKVLLGPRGRWGTTGTLIRPWNIIENVPRDVLLEKGHERRRRVRFGREPRRDR